MKMFKFGFSSETEPEVSKNLDGEGIQWLESHEVQPDKSFTSDLLSENFTDYTTFKYGKNTNVRCVSTNTVVAKLRRKSLENSALQADRSHSDLITGVYEGGLKIWECTHDLASFICHTKLILENKRVLDLGCGAGVLGILALLKGSHSNFQDYNYEVIRYTTIPNVILSADDKLSNCKFYSGDWMSFLDKIKDQTGENKYDFIFTSETIYNPDNYKKLISIFKNTLREDGTVYLAAKIHYFGVGGGLREFEDVVKQENSFDFFTCWKCSEGVQREIVALKFKT